VRLPPKEVHIRDLVTLSGGVSTGRFSPDFGKLLIGDSTGKVHLFASLNEDGLETIPARSRKPIKPHSPLPAPLIDDDEMDIAPPQTGKESAQQFIDRQELVIHDDEYVGAVQGPNYRSTGLFYDAELYQDENGRYSEGWSAQELLAKQQRRLERQSIILDRLPVVRSSSHVFHQRNIKLDFDVRTLPVETIQQLWDARAELDTDDDFEFNYDFGPRIGVDDKENGTSIEDDLLGELLSLNSFEINLH
jgi:hypothetical protein